MKDFPVLERNETEGLHRNSDAPLPARHSSKENQNTLKAGNNRSAAVLIPLIKTNEQWHILYIRRASNQHDRHSGQVAFPGGSAEQSDTSAANTALRETEEEIGISADRIKIIGELDDYFTVSNFRVRPVVGIVQWPSNLKLQTSEVARAFLIPMAWLRDEQNFTFRARSEMDKQSAKKHPIIVYNDYDDETLWGATARMTVNFIKAVDDQQILLPS